jgi:hypothetical protein
VRISAAALGTPISIVGTGLAMALPDQKWIGWAIVVLGIAIFALQVRYENGHVRVSARHAKMWPVIGMTLSALAFVAFAIWYQTTTSAEGLKINIQSVNFDSNGPTEIHVDFKLSNLGPPSTVEDWNLTIKRGDRVLWSHAPRVTFSMTADPTMPRGYRPPLDLSKQPLAAGEQMTPHFTWTYEGNARDAFDHPGTSFALSARDIRGREISGSYVLP